MGKNPNSYEKKRREVEKKFKAEEKRKNRLRKKLAGPEVPAVSSADAPTESNESLSE